MKLLLMRHGEASSEAITDAKRPLTAIGRASVIRQAGNSIVPWPEFTRVWASPYLRAQQTGSLVLENYRHKTHQLKLQTLNCITPHGDIDQVESFLLEQEHQGIVMITHQPLISSLIGQFCYADQYLGDPMMPASMALLEGEVATAGTLRLTHLFHS